MALTQEPEAQKSSHARVVGGPEARHIGSYIGHIADFT